MQPNKPKQLADKKDRDPQVHWTLLELKRGSCTLLSSWEITRIALKFKFEKDIQDKLKTV